MKISKFVLSFLLAVSTSWVTEASPLLSEVDTRIIGGDEAKPGEYPYYVDFGYCGGTLIAPDVVLSAAHCAFAFNNQQVSISAYKKFSIKNGAQDRFCEETIVHPLYDYWTRDNDFALCKLNKPVELGQTTITLQLNEDDSIPAEHDVLWAVGLGVINKKTQKVAKKLQEVALPYVSNGVCTELYNPPKYIITDSMLCAGYPEGRKDSCQGDSGGPLFRIVDNGDGTQTHVHMGVVSWGKGCAKPNFPGVYARTSKRADWIKHVTCNELHSVAPFCNNAASPPSTIECGDDEEELLIQVTTDAKGDETKWEIANSEGDAIMVRKYYFDRYENKHTLCVKPNSAYQFNITDSNGMCARNECGSYNLSVNGEVLVSGDGNFAGYKLYSFIVPAPSSYPSLEPSSSSSGPSSQPSAYPSLEPSFKPSAQQSLELSSQPSSEPSAQPSSQPSACEDNEAFKKGKNKLSCDEFIVGKKKKKERRCNKEWKGDPVYNWCPKSCGAEVGIGPCDWLKNVNTIYE